MMQSRLREIRQSQGLTLADIAARCTPPTTAVTIGRLETGSRQLTVPWMEKLGRALSVDPRQLIAHASDQQIPVAAELDSEGAKALRSPLSLHAPIPPSATIGIIVRDSQGDYRSGDQIWMEQLPPERFTEALNTDVLAPKPVGKFVFGRLVAIEDGKLHILPVRSGSRQVGLTDAPWIARAHTLVRSL